MRANLWSKLAAAVAFAVMVGCGSSGSSKPPVDAGRVDSSTGDAAMPDAAVADSSTGDSAMADATVDAAVAPMCSADHNGHLALINATTGADSVTHDPTLPLLPTSGVLPPPQ